MYLCVGKFGILEKQANNGWLLDVVHKLNLEKWSKKFVKDDKFT